MDRKFAFITEEDEWRHWRCSVVVDLAGENLSLPEDVGTVNNRNGLWTQNLIAGAIAGGISRTCTAPFDRLKTVMQVLGSRKQITIIGGFKFMLNEGGVTALWRGNGINVIKIAPEAALKFTIYEEVKHLFIIDGKDREATIAERFMSGSIAGCLAQSAIYPLEVLKTRLVLRKTGEYSSAIDCINKIIKNEGIRAFYKGYLPNILGIIPYAGTDLTIYETLKRFYMKENAVQDPSVPVLLLCGTVSTICGQLVSYPLSLVRTRLQAQELPMDSNKRDTMTKLLVSIWQKEGIRGLYRGLLPNILKVVPAVSITYAVYENVKKGMHIDPSSSSSSLPPSSSTSLSPSTSSFKPSSSQSSSSPSSSASQSSSTTSEMPLKNNNNNNNSQNDSIISNDINENKNSSISNTIVVDESKTSIK